MENESSIDIARSREVVFDFLNDPKNLKKIVPNLVDEGVIEETPGKVGTTFWHVYEEHGRKMKMTGVVTEYQRPDRSAVKLDGAMFGLDVTYRLEESGPNATRLTQVARVQWKHVFKIMGLLMRKRVKEEGLKTQAENFARLKAMLEEGSPA